MLSGLRLLPVAVCWISGGVWGSVLAEEVLPVCPRLAFARVDTIGATRDVLCTRCLVHCINLALVSTSTANASFRGPS